MKIAFIDRHTYVEGDSIYTRPLSGGISSYCYSSRELAKLGHTVKVYTFCKNLGWRQYAKKAYDYALNNYTWDKVALDWVEEIRRA